MGIPTLFDKVTVILELFSSFVQSGLANDNLRASVNHYVPCVSLWHS